MKIFSKNGPAFRLVKEDVVTLITAAHCAIERPWKSHSHSSGHDSDNSAKQSDSSDVF
jgi:hypothetical protein